MLTAGTTLYALAMLALVLGLIMGLGWVLRTYGSRFGLSGAAASRTPTLRVLERLPLTPQHSLVKVADSTNEYVIGISPQGINLVNKVVKTKKPKP